MRLLGGNLKDHDVDLRMLLPLECWTAGTCFVSQTRRIRMAKSDRKDTSRKLPSWKAIVVVAMLCLGAGPLRPQSVLDSGDDSIKGLAYSPDGKLLATGGNEGTVKIWEASSGKELFEFKSHFKAVFALTFSPDGTTLASGSDDNTIRLWNTATGKELSKYELPDTVDSIAFTRDGKQLAVGSGGTIWMLDLKTHHRKTLCKDAHRYVIATLGYSPDQKMLVSSGWDGRIALWDATTGKQIAVLLGHKSNIRKVVFSPNGKELASASTDGTLRLWNVEARKERGVVRVPDAGSCTDVAYANDGKYLVAVHADGGLRVWNAKTGKCLVVIAAHEKCIMGMTVSPDSKQVATGSLSGRAKLWGFRELLRAEKP
jgi:WD40 repeat protein